MAGIQIDALPHSCGTRHGLKVFAKDDGEVDGYCFSCSSFIADPYGDGRKVSDLPKRVEKTEAEIQAEIAEVDSYPTVDIPTRKLRKGTLDKFQAKTSLSEQDGTTPTAIYWPVTKAGKRTGYHVKILDKSCPPFNMGDTRDCDLLNWENAKTSGAYRLIITEGPEDMASVDRIYEMYGDVQYAPALVSLPHGASSAKKVLTKHAEDIRRLFKEVVLCFDDDAAGQAAVEKAMLALPFAKSVKLPTKDANQALLEGKAKAAYSALAYHAEAPKNTRIVTGNEVHEKAKEPAKFGKLSWPWKQMNEDLRGIRLGETIYLGAGTKLGKALPNSSVIPTPQGERVFSTISVGDTLFGTNGPTTVLGVYPQGSLSIYNMTFDDGSVVASSEDHLWTIQDRKNGVKLEKELTLTTQQIKIRLEQFKKSRMMLPPIAPVVYDQEKFLTSPYTIGVWLGDGANSCGRVCNPETFIWDKIQDEGFKLGLSGSIDKCRTHTVLGLVEYLHSYGLLHNKHIPKDYLEGSVQQRLEMLQGLLDTDGWINPANGKTLQGTVKWGSTDLPLYKDFITLGRSLGLKIREGKPKETGHKLFYHLTISNTTNLPLFTLPKKVVRMRAGTHKGHTLRKIVSVEFSHWEQATCIEVDSPDKLFLCEHFTPTHNTTVKNALAAHFIQEDKAKVFMACPEEPNVMTYKLLANQLTGKIFHDPTIPFDEVAYEEAGKVLKDHLYMLNLYQHLGWESLKKDITAAAALGVEAVFIDPITSLSNGVDSRSANTLLQTFAQELAAMAEDMQFTAFIFAHLKAPEGQIAEDKRNAYYKKGQYLDLGNCSHEMGGSVYSSQFAGSRAMQRSAHLMLSLLGNKDPDLPEEIRNTRELRVLEDRMYGGSGKYRLFWNKNTGRFMELDT